jgi:hypothetical protein
VICNCWNLVRLRINSAEVFENMGKISHDIEKPASEKEKRQMDQKLFQEQFDKMVFGTVPRTVNLFATSSAEEGWEEAISWLGVTNL